ncbi:hypothetical protein C7M84_002399 [Penaeus vannamei]|uniref:Gelsolin-like domain-containing protein n=1 Tax=Penaeus vannamei TaxID=6689 RepID=A0A423TR03_PENVA|nr:hypothetical protein C7M84_002399 [Penaeus vannamei]
MTRPQVQASPPPPISEELKLFKCSEESGVLKVTEVKNGPLVQTDLTPRCVMRASDSFIVDNGPDGIWVWVGKKATQKERDEALRNAQGFITKKGYPTNTKVSRVIDNGEPPEFKTLFKDWKDKDQSKGFGRQASSRPPRGLPQLQRLFRVATPQTTYVWCGKGSTGDEREMAKTYASSRGDTFIVSEGHEKEEFWRALGGKEAYATTPKLKEEHPAHSPRLFQCSNATGVFKAEEVVNFSQVDLVDDDVMLLDAWDCVFLWIGHNSNKDPQEPLLQAGPQPNQTCLTQGPQDPNLTPKPTLGPPRPLLQAGPQLTPTFLHPRPEHVTSDALALEYLRTDPAGRKTSLIKLNRIRAPELHGTLRSLVGQRPVDVSGRGDRWRWEIGVFGALCVGVVWVQGV